MLIAALRTSTYGAGCPTICLRMCCNIPRALSLIFRTSYATRAVVRPPELLLQRSGALLPSAPRPSEAILPDPCGRVLLDGGRRAESTGSSRCTADGLLSSTTYTVPASRCKRRVPRLRRPRTTPSVMPSACEACGTVSRRLDDDSSPIKGPSPTRRIPDH
jgi:hypothetical protein